MAEVRKMVLNRNFTLDTLFGHSIRFEKGIPTLVPPICQHLAMAIGAEFDDGKGVIVDETPGYVAPTDPGVRAEAVLKAINTLVARNDKDDFTAGGAPKVASVTKLTVFVPSSKEISSAWQAMHDAQQAEKFA